MSKKGSAVSLTQAQVNAHNARRKAPTRASAAALLPPHPAPLDDAPKEFAGVAVPTPKQRLQALGRLPAGTMNKTEKAYDETLAADRSIAWRRFEGMKLRLADNTFYTPDFAVMRTDGALECHEVKGFWTDDARVKIKVAAGMYPILFVAAQKRPAKDGGGWALEYF